MSQPQTAVTYESVLELIRQVSEQMKAQSEETDRKIQETKQQMFQEAVQRSQEAAQRSQEAAQRSQEADRRSQEADQRMKKLDERMERTSREISALGSRVGEIVENMVGGDIVEQFQALGYDVNECSRNKIFGKKGSDASGEIDLLLEDGDIAILIEAKTTLKTDDVKDHIERLEKYRRHIDEKINSIDRRKFVGAVAAASVADHVIKFAQRSGLYVIVQAGKTVEIIAPPEGFVAKKW